MILSRIEVAIITLCTLVVGACLGHTLSDKDKTAIHVAATECVILDAGFADTFCATTEELNLAAPYLLQRRMAKRIVDAGADQ